MEPDSPNNLVRIGGTSLPASSRVDMLFHDGQKDVETFIHRGKLPTRVRLEYQKAAEKASDIDRSLLDDNDNTMQHFRDDGGGGFDDDDDLNEPEGGEEE